jgi:acetyl esterase/lipase
MKSGGKHLRSVQSILVEGLMTVAGNKKKRFSNVGYQYLIHKKYKKNSKSYRMPVLLQESYQVEEQYFRGMRCYIFSPEQETDCIILYLHGGGYIDQPLLWHWRFLNKLSTTAKAKIVVPIYPKSPNYTYEQVVEAILPLYQDMALGIGQGRFVIMGDSAGGGLALVLAQQAKTLDVPQVKEIILISPWLDMSMTNPEIPAYQKYDPRLGKTGLIQIARLYAGGADLKNPLLSPIYGDCHGLGRITLFIGTHEILYPDAQRFYRLLEEQQIPVQYFEYEKMNHDFLLSPIPEAEQAIEQIISTLSGK